MSLVWLPRLQSKLEQLCTAYMVPYGVVIGWIQVESGGRLNEVTSLDERGYFQLLPDESKDLGIDHQRLSTDADYSLEAGFKLVSYYRNAIARRCAMNNITSVLPMTEYYWRIIKLAHSMGSGSIAVMLREAEVANAAGSWESFRSYLIANDAYFLHKTKHSPAKWLGLIDRMFNIGRPYGNNYVITAA